MAAVKHLLLGTLNYLRNEEFKKFKRFLQRIFPQKNLSYSSWRLESSSVRAEFVDLMVNELGQRSVEATRKVFLYMKRTDLIQKLSESSSGSREKLSVDEDEAAPWKREEADEKLLLETLKKLSEQELKELNWFLKFTCFKMDLPQITIYTNMTDKLLDLMVYKLGQQSVEVIMEVFRDMKRTDLVQRLSESSSGLKAARTSAEGFDVEDTEREKHSKDERWPALIHQVETMESVIELLLETLAALNDQELEEFKKVLFEIHHDGYKDHSDFPQMLHMRTDLQDTVFLMVQTYGQQSVEKTMEGFKKMKRTDLAQRLSDCSSLPRKKHSVDDRHSALIHTVATMAAVKHLLLGTLNDLSNKEFKEFKRFLKMIFPQKNLLNFSWRLESSSVRAEFVDLMVNELGQVSVEATRKAFLYMKRTDLIQKISESSSGSREKLSVDEDEAALWKKAEELEAVRQILFETLKDLKFEDLNKFRLFLKFTYFKMGLPRIQTYTNMAEELVDQVVDKLGQQSVEVIMEVLTDMKRTDLLQRLSESSSGLKEKPQISLFQTEASMTSVMEKVLEDLSFSELEHFKRVLQQRVAKRGFQRISASQLETADRADVVQLMVQTCGDESVEVTREVLTLVSRTDLVQRLSESSSGLKGRETGGSSESEDCGSVTQDSSDWPKLEPEVNGTDADEAPTYSLQSEAGHFECSVSGLRWVCKEKASFQYQFSSWEGHMERMESRGYMPAGPLMDVALTAGKLNEVHLPHWICTDDIPDILDKFAVLHIDDCGDVVEKVSEVTPSHVKLIKPIFSPRAVLMKVGIPVKISCNVLIYQTNTAFLTLHVYLVPCDPGLQQVLRQREMSHGYKAILKPDPEKSLKMLNRFTLTADGAEICPPDLKLRYPSGKPNFFEVYIENPDGNFQLKLTTKKEFQPVWSCTVRKAEYQSVGHVQENHFVDKHRVELIQRVSNVGPILDELLKEQVIHQESYDRIRALPTSQEMTRELYNGPLKAGSASKDVFYQILQTHERRLVNDLC